jgi:N-sulfoglucosamine sulfohydrolase
MSNYKKHIIYTPVLFGVQLFSSSLLIAQDKPNVIILIADDISYNDFGCYGHPVVKTPNIDALAADGMRFTNAFLTTSSSSPSRSSIITGRYPHNTGACELHSLLGEEQVFLPKILKDAGYYTAQAGKWHLGGVDPKPFGPVLKAFDRTGGSFIDGGGASGAEKFVPYLKERPKNKPFFMWFAAHDAHRAWDNDIFLDKYKPESIVLDSCFVDDMPTREDFAAYYNEISRFDFYVGKVVEELKNQGIYNNTMIVIMADNGRPFPRAKTLLIDEGIKTPLVIHYPEMIKTPGSVSKSIISSIDLAPTIAALAGVKSSATFQGKSFAALLDNPTKKFRKYAFAEHNWHDFEAYERMVCTDKYILIENKRPQFDAQGAKDVMGGGAGLSLKKGFKDATLTEFQKEIFVTPRSKIELYDRTSDPKQLKNIAANNLSIVKTLQKVLHRWQNETSDTEPSELTPDWYSRETLKALPTNNQRKEMPGEAKNAKLCLKKGPF